VCVGAILSLYFPHHTFHSPIISVGRMKCKDSPTIGRALDQSVYEFLVSKTNHNMVFEIKSFLGGGVDVAERRPTSARTLDEDEILRRRCRMRKWSV